MLNQNRFLDTFRGHSKRTNGYGRNYRLYMDSDHEPFG